MVLYNLCTIALIDGLFQMQIIGRAAQEARDSFNESRQAYFILLILTDGIISDLRETTREIVQASSLPLSIGMFHTSM